ncbi:hypothetical protein ACLKA7_000767 [Drosophila subpalustris]
MIDTKTAINYLGVMIDHSRSSKSSYTRCTLRVATCFRTVSEDAALVIAGMTPFNLLAPTFLTGYRCFKAYLHQ